jgi:hypothetical protein
MRLVIDDVLDVSDTFETVPICGNCGVPVDTKDNKSF